MFQMESQMPGCPDDTIGRYSIQENYSVFNDSFQSSAEECFGVYGSGVIIYQEAREGEDAIIIGVFGVGFVEVVVSYFVIGDYKVGNKVGSGVSQFYLLRISF